MTKSRRIKDSDLIEELIKDHVFISSIEESLGKLKRVYANYKLGKLIYEFENGDYKESSIKRVCQKLIDIKYLNSISH